MTATVEETQVPGALTDMTATLGGSYDVPESIDLSWTPDGGDSHVFTHIPINHHAGGATFTECQAEMSAGSIHVDAPMLKPLAVATGLEFQTVDHVRFAAAETGRGCIEFRFVQHQFVDF